MPEFNEKQTQVIESRDANLLVSAAAGSGKTTVLVHRILGRIMDPVNPVNIDEILVLTFTIAAAGEMRDRIANAIREEIARQPDNEHLKKQSLLIYNAQISTIDSFVQTTKYTHNSPCIQCIHMTKWQAVFLNNCCKNYSIFLFYVLH